MECPKCGAENSNDRSSCSSCFASLSSAPSSKANKVVVGTPKASKRPEGSLQADGASNDAERIPVRPREYPRSNSESSGGAKKSLAVIPIVVIVVGLIAAWWFFMANPKPEAAAKDFVTALNSAISGDLNPMKAIVSKSSQNKLDSLSSIASQTAGKDLKIIMGDIKSSTVTGNKANVTIETGISIGGKELPFKVPMNISLVKEGSFISPKWKVDQANSTPMGGSMPGMAQ